MLYNLTGTLSEGNRHVLAEFDLFQQRDTVNVINPDPGLFINITDYDDYYGVIVIIIHIFIDIIIINRLYLKVQTREHTLVMKWI